MIILPLILPLDQQQHDPWFEQFLQEFRQYENQIRNGFPNNLSIRLNEIDFDFFSRVVHLVFCFKSHFVYSLITSLKMRMSRKADVKATKFLILRNSG